LVLEGKKEKKKKQTVLELYMITGKCPSPGEEYEIEQRRALWSTLRRCGTSCVARQETSDNDLYIPQR
jgi:hypothetical protein